HPRTRGPRGSRRVRPLRNSPRVVVAILSLAVLGLSVPGARGSTAGGKNELRVFAAASLSDAFNDLGRQLEAQRQGLTVRMNFAGSEQLAAQLEQGAIADVFASADERWMDFVRDRGLLAGEAELFARNRLVVIVPSTNPARIRKLQDLSRSGV